LGYHHLLFRVLGCIFLKGAVEDLPEGVNYGVIPKPSHFLTPAGVYQLVKDCRVDFTIFRYFIHFRVLFILFQISEERKHRVRLINLAKSR